MSRGDEFATGGGGGTLYHVAPKAHRDSVLRHGIDWKKGPNADTPLVVDDDVREFEAPRANYLYKSRQSADEARYSGADVWAVKATGLPLHPDPFEDAEAVLTHATIHPHRLTLLSDD